MWQTDRLTPRPWLRRAKHSAIARKNHPLTRLQDTAWPRVFFEGHSRWTGDKVKVWSEVCKDNNVFFVWWQRAVFCGFMCGRYAQGYFWVIAAAEFLLGKLSWPGLVYKNTVSEWFAEVLICHRSVDAMPRWLLLNKWQFLTTAAGSLGYNSAGLQESCMQREWLWLLFYLAE